MVLCRNAAVSIPTGEEFRHRRPTQRRTLLPLPVLAWLALLLEREGGRAEDRDGDFSNSATVYKTPANGENMVLTHMSNRVYATLAYFFTVAESTFVMVC